ncbi:nuclear pore complex subunit [Saitoella coloradoensis]
MNNMAPPIVDMSSGKPNPNPSFSVLNDILAQSKKLTTELQLLQPEIPQIQLSLEQIETRAKDLAQKAAEAARDGDSKAHLVLAGSGVNPAETKQDLAQIRFPEPIDPLVPSHVARDVDRHLRYKKEQNITSAIDESIRRTQKDFEAFVARNINLDWEKQKQRVFESIGLATRTGDDKDAEKPGASVFGKSMGFSMHKRSLSRSVLGKSVLGVFDKEEFQDVGEPRKKPTSGSLTSHLRRQQFATVVKHLNDLRLKGTPFGIISAFSALSNNAGNKATVQQLGDAWKLMGVLANEENVHNGEFYGDSITERQYAKQYAATIPRSKDTTALNNHITAASRKWLEEQFRVVVDNLIVSNPQLAQIGGVPSINNKIRGYLNVRFKQDGEWNGPNFELVEDYPIWAHIFYLIRAGRLEEAVKFTEANDAWFQNGERSFPTYIRTYATSPDRRLPRQLRDRLHADFNQRIRFLTEDTDPYKHAVYKIIGRCELNRRSLRVLSTTEDWMWLQFALARETVDPNEPIQDRYTLEDVQKLVLTFGAKHFNASGQNAIVYFQVLLMTGQFERAVHYMYSYHYIDAVHFAIALTYYGLLRVPAESPVTEADLLILDQERDISYINFARLICVYVRDFRQTDPEEAIDYLALICLNGDLPAPKSAEQRALCHSAIRELVLETRQYDRLIGDVRADGTRIPGAIEQKMRLIQLSNEKDYLRTITEQAAAQADNDARTNDAVLLYHLSEAYDTVVSIINKKLGDAIADMTTDIAHAPHVPQNANVSLAASEDAAVLAKNMIDVYANNAAIIRSISVVNREACDTLQKMLGARKLYESGDWENALQVIEQLDFLPLLSADLTDVRHRAQQFASLHESIAKNVSNMVIMAMESMQAISMGLKESTYTDPSRVAKLKEIKRKAKNAVVYAGLIQYRMPAEVYTKLMRLEVMI